MKTMLIFLKKIWRQFIANIWTIAAFVVIGSVLFVWAEYTYIESKPTTKYVQYYDFNVTGGYEGEDIPFKICRRYVSQYRFEGQLRVVIFTDPASDKTKPVYSRNFQGLLDGEECSTRYLTSKDFKHTPGIYQMNFSICFKVKYGIEKCTTYASNPYRIRPLPDSTDERINVLQSQIDSILRERSGGGGQALAPSNGSQITFDDAPPNGSEGGANPGNGQSDSDNGTTLGNTVRAVGGAAGDILDAAGNFLRR